MKINRKPLKVAPRKPTFFEWVLGSPKAFSIVWRIALVAPCVMFTISAALGFYFASWLAWPMMLMVVLAYYNLWRNRQWFKTETSTTIGGMVWGLKVENDDNMTKRHATRPKPEQKSDVQFIDDKEDLREVEKK